LAQGFVFGLALSVASTVVLLRALQERRIVQTERGRIAVGWLIVEDLAMVLALVFLPALAQAGGGGPSSGVAAWLPALGLTLAKVAAFVAFMLIVGKRVIPWVLHYIAHTGSRELFRLAVLTIALGVAFGAASLFGVSFALGAFFAGMILAESELSQRAAEETLPLRDAFAVLFFVSVGMLFNPMVVLREPLPLLGTLAIILLGKSAAALVIMRLYRRSAQTSFVVAASLAQIGEFSFILAGLGVQLDLLPREGRDLILAGAIISILLNPLVFVLAKRLARNPRVVQMHEAGMDGPVVTAQTEHTVLVGFGRVGETVAHGLDLAGAPFVVVEDNDEIAARAQTAGYECIGGNAADPRVLASTNIAQARRLFVAVPNAFEAGQIVQQARRANPDLEVVARAHSDAESAHLNALGADTTIMGEREIAQRMLEEALGHRKGEETEGPPPAAASPAVRPAGVILADAEHAVLTGFKDRAASPFIPVSKADLYPHAEALGFSAQRISEAILSLEAQHCLVDLGDGRLSLTESGRLALAATKGVS
jgi:CPA2 family monovalent cation:H+ antiporter-2